MACRRNIGNKTLMEYYFLDMRNKYFIDAVDDLVKERRESIKK